MTDSNPAEAGASPALPYNPAIDGHSKPGPGGPLIAPHLDNSFTEARHGRHDGWTPERKRLFHERLAEVGVVSEAARAAGMSAQSAYNLRHRDPLFDAGWDAALLLARRRLADDLYARAVNGCVEQIHKDGVIVAERHRYDNRLSIAVLTRLDTRLDRSTAERGADVRVAARWDDYLDALGEDRTDDVRALAFPPDPAELAKIAQQHKLHQLREDAAMQDLHTVWRDDDGDLWTDYPPPPGLDPDDEEGSYGDDDYRRRLTPDEEEPVAAFYAEQAEDGIDPDCHRQRDAFFDDLRRQHVDRAAGDTPADDEASGDDRDPDPT